MSYFYIKWDILNHGNILIILLYSPTSVVLFIISLDHTLLEFNRALFEHI